MADVAQLRTEAERLEQELTAAKESDMDTAEYRDLKLRVRKARWAYRIVRSGGRLEDGEAALETIGVAAATGERG